MKTPCPSREELLRFFEGGMSLDEKEALIDHQFGCPECRVKFEVLVAVEKETKANVEELAAKGWTPAEFRAAGKTDGGRATLRELGSKRRPFAFWRGFSPAAKVIAAAAAAALILGVVAVAVFKPFGRPETYRDQSLGRTVRLISPKGVIHAPPDKFVWEPVKGADNYGIRLTDEDLRLICQIGVWGTTFVLEESHKKLLVPGKVYIWSVTTKNEINEIIAFARESFIIK